jgi:hypothetical protein
MINWIRYFLVVSALTKDFCSGKGLKIGWKIRGFFVWHYTCHLNLVVYTVKLSAKWGGIHISAKWIFFAISPRFCHISAFFPISPRFSQISAFMIFLPIFPYLRVIFPYLRVFEILPIFPYLRAFLFFPRKKTRRYGKKVKFQKLVVPETIWKLFQILMVNTVCMLIFWTTKVPDRK